MNRRDRLYRDHCDCRCHVRFPRHPRVRRVEEHWPYKANLGSDIGDLRCKFVIAMTFMVPVVIHPLDQAIVISVIWGLLLPAALSFFVALAQAIPPWKVISEHLLIVLCVVAMTHAVGDWVQGLVEEE